MKSLLFKSLSLICFIIVFSCTPDNVSAEKNIQIQSVDGKYIKFFGEADVLDLQYSNLIITTNSGKEILQPIFRGSKGNIRYEDLRQYCINLGKLESIEGSIRPIQVLCKKNEVKKTFYEFLTFYKGNLLKDVDVEQPIKMVEENGTWTIRYNFVINGVPGYMTIDIDGKEGDYKSVYDIQIDENGGSFLYDINIRRTAL